MNFGTLLIFTIINILLSARFHPSFSYVAKTEIQRCFPDIPGVTACIDSRFLSFWESNGGLPTFGYPLSPAHQEETPEGIFWVQYFERQRLEWHPENPPPYNVLLGRLGDELLQRSGRNWRTFPTVSNDSVIQSHTTNCRRFDITRFIVCDPFMRAWQAQGLEFDGRSDISFSESLALWGLPISPMQWETTPSGDLIMVQWFERSRFEWYPNNSGTVYEVLKGRLAAELLVENERFNGSLVSGERLWEYRDGELIPWMAYGVNYNPPWAPWALWDQWDADRVAEDLDQIVALGANVVRVALPWRNFRRSSPNSSTARASFQQFVQLAGERKLRVIPILFDEFCKYGKPDGNTCWHHWVWDHETAELAATLPGQYRNNPTVALWEITNEPGWVNNNMWTWQNEYRQNRIEWLKQAVQQVRRVAPYHPLIVGVSFPHEARDVIAAGISQIVSLHYYPEIHNGRAALANELAALSDMRLPILIGEIGISSSPQFGGSEIGQAVFLCNVLELVDLHQVGFLWWHLQASDSQDWESQLGLYRADGSAKPAADVFAGRRQCDVTKKASTFQP
ncbi:cellulase family glycosylhydrolase [Chloroflexus sp.]|uniref:cellulase family glycosylhydrolase n=1 Tax=Chloroflexus sp. TaxID=1904827 RepID=UPI00404908C2